MIQNSKKYTVYAVRPNGQEWLVATIAMNGTIRNVLDLAKQISNEWKTKIGHVLAVKKVKTNFTFQ